MSTKSLTTRRAVLAAAAAVLARLANQVAAGRIHTTGSGEADVVDSLDAALDNVARRVRGNTDSLAREVKEAVEGAIQTGNDAAI